MSRAKMDTGNKFAEMDLRDEGEALGCRRAKTRLLDLLSTPPHYLPLAKTKNEILFRQFYHFAYFQTRARNFQLLIISG